MPGVVTQPLLRIFAGALAVPADDTAVIATTVVDVVAGVATDLDALPTLAALPRAARLAAAPAVTGVALRVDAEVATLRVATIGAATDTIQASQVPLALLATTTAVRLITLGVDALRATAHLARRAGRVRRLADATHTGRPTATAMAASPAVQGIGAGIDTDLAALDRSTLALLLLLLLFGEDRGVLLPLPGISVIAVVFPLPFLPGLNVAADKPGETGQEAAEHGAARGPAASEVIEPRSIHAVLQSPAKRSFLPLHIGR